MTEEKGNKGFTLIQAYIAIGVLLFGMGISWGITSNQQSTQQLRIEQNEKDIKEMKVEMRQTIDLLLESTNRIEHNLLRVMEAQKIPYDKDFGKNK